VSPAEFSQQSSCEGEKQKRGSTIGTETSLLGGALSLAEKKGGTFFFLERGRLGWPSCEETPAGVDAPPHREGKEGGDLYAGNKKGPSLLFGLKEKQILLQRGEKRWCSRKFTKNLST